MKKLLVYSDGASKGNPGDAGIGVVIRSTAGDVISETADYIGKTTNNVAEYKALLRGLEMASDLRADEVIVRSDSQLLVMQLCGAYKVKSEHLRPLHAEACRLLASFGCCRVEHIPREENRRADELANEGVKRGKNRAVADLLKSSLNKAANSSRESSGSDSSDGGQTTLGL